MADKDKHDDDEALQDQDEVLESEEVLADQAVDQPVDQAVAGEDGQAEEEKTPLQLEVKIDNRSACERHITVAVSREDIDRYLNKEFSELMADAHVPGFRPGHAPRKLVENRFRKDVVGRVKGRC